MELDVINVKMMLACEFSAGLGALEVQWYPDLLAHCSHTSLQMVSQRAWEGSSELSLSSAA